MRTNRGVDRDVASIPRRFDAVWEAINALRSERRIPGSGIDYTVADRASAAAAAAIAAAERAEQALAAATIGEVSLSPLRAALARHRLKPARIVFFGSSTTAGALASEIALSYVNIFTRRIQSAYPSGVEGYEYGTSNQAVLAFSTLRALPGVQVLNSAAGGTTAANYISTDSVTYAGAIQPDCFIHMIGANDYQTGVNPTLYRSQIEGRMDALEAELDHPTCHVLIHSYRRTDVVSPAYPWDAYGAALKAIATRDNVMFLDISDEYADLGHDGVDAYDLLSTDNIHQTDVGHAHTADLLYRALTPSPSSPLAPLVLSDSFTRPPGVPGVAEFPAGAAWTVTSGAWAVVAGPTGGALGLTTGGNILVECGVADLDITAVITPGAAAVVPGILFRAADDANRLGFFINPAADLAQIYRVDAGVNVLVASTAYTLNPTHWVLRVIARGNKITCFINGALVLTYTLSTADQTKYGVFTKVGFRCSVAHADLKFWGLSVRRPL